MDAHNPISERAVHDTLEPYVMPSRLRAIIPEARDTLYRVGRYVIRRDDTRVGHTDIPVDLAAVRERAE